MTLQNVQEGKEEAVRQMLHKPQRTSEEVHLKLCHPLCFCDRCEKILSATRNDYNLVTAFTRDNRGYTGQLSTLWSTMELDLVVHGSCRGGSHPACAGILAQSTQPRWPSVKGVRFKSRRFGARILLVTGFFRVQSYQ